MSKRKFIEISTIENSLTHYKVEIHTMNERNRRTYQVSTARTNKILDIIGQKEINVDLVFGTIQLYAFYPPNIKS